jgi:tropinone reductase I
MTKAAMAQLSKNLGCEWAKDNIRVNCIAPWYEVLERRTRYEIWKWWWS